MAENVFSLLAAAQAELSQLVAAAEKAPATTKGLKLLVTTHGKISDKIKSVLSSLREPLVWRHPESDTWRTVYNGLEVMIHRDAGMYYWTVSSTWQTHANTLDAAKTAIDQLLRPPK